ncbi:hypothetical protein [Paraburkholderia acidisoli]|uniref:Uncharacterized protein n=1 Tax=Paraburkholderia acidisoli TaxID=2571748 RepID=A0A7Z2GN85_9BURK|nr:hypothetical protein [Paraburkholderia acidisoli]QGZ64706.1 hypothetical protein FAZ98_23020 [Paraburkholderia acidisoli]
MENAMGKLVIKDLPENVELDRQAMAAITGGARVASHQTLLAPRPFPKLHAVQAHESVPESAASSFATRPHPTLLR